MRFFFLICFAILAARPAVAQSIQGKISGSISNKNQTALEGVTVQLKSLKDSTYARITTSDDKGTFVFTELPAGMYRVTASMVNYQEYVYAPISISSMAAQANLPQIVLVEGEIALAQVTITGRKPLIETKIDRVVMNVENSILASGNSALDILQRAPGLTVENDGNISLVGKQNVIVMINDKPTYLSQTQLAALLRSTDGSTIKEIEIISNPSAKYDAAGTGGIVNIKLKKNLNSGLNGSATAGLGYGTFYKSNGGLNLNYGQGKLNLFGSYFYTNNKRFQDYFIDRVNESGTERIFFSEDSRAIARNISNNYKAGIDFNINSKHVVGLVFTGYTFDQQEAVETQTYIGGSPSVIDSSVTSANRPENFFSNNSINLNYVAILDTIGQKFSFDLDYSRFRGDQFTAYHNSFYQGNFGALKYEQFSRNYSPYAINIKSAKVDFTQPVNKSARFDLGAKLSHVKTDNNLIFESLQTGNWVNDPGLSNTFLYAERISAGYINYFRGAGHTSIQVGLRAEQTKTVGNSVSQNLLKKRNYVNLFPSLFVNQKLSDLHQLNFSYSRRIERPNYQDLNPFVYYLDQYTYGKGNPDLNPQYTNAFELSFLSKTKLGFSATLGYSDTRDAITEVILADTAQKALYQTYENLARNRNFYLNMNVSAEIGGFWTTNNSIGAFRNSFISPNVMGQSFNSAKTSINLKTINNFKLGKSTSAELYGNYQTAAIYGIVEVDPRYTVDIGIRQSFGQDNQTDLKLSLSDIFNTYARKISSILANNPYHVEYKNETQILRLTFSYRFGIQNAKNRTDRQGGADSEKNRAGNNRN